MAKSKLSERPHHSKLSESMPVHKLDNAALMRTEKQTRSEARFWEMLKQADRLSKWRRQVPMLGYIADFYCPCRRLVVEIDGGYHRARRDEDIKRDQVFWDRAKIRTLRFKNWEIDEHAERVAAFVASFGKRKAKWTRRGEIDEDLNVKRDASW